MTGLEGASRTNSNPFYLAATHLNGEVDAGSNPPAEVEEARDCAAAVEQTQPSGTVCTVSAPHAYRPTCAQSSHIPAIAIVAAMLSMHCEERRQKARRTLGGFCFHDDTSGSLFRRSLTDVPAGSP